MVDTGRARIRPWWALAAIGILLVVLAGACSGDDGGGTASETEETFQEPTEDTAEEADAEDLGDALNELCENFLDERQELDDAGTEALDEARADAGGSLSDEEALPVIAPTVEAIAQLTEDLVDDLDELEPSEDEEEDLEVFVDEVEDVVTLATAYAEAAGVGDLDAVNGLQPEVDEIDPVAAADAVEALDADECRTVAGDEEDLAEPTPETTVPAPTDDTIGGGGEGVDVQAYCDLVQAYLDDPTDSELAAQVAEAAQELTANAAQLTPEDAQLLAECAAQFSTGG